MRTVSLISVVLALGFAGGFCVGVRVHKPAPVAVNVAAGPRPELDLSPKGEVGTVKAPRITQAAQRVPVVAPPELGAQLQTTTAILPALEAGARFHLATFGQIEGNRLQLRPVAWLEGAQGARIPFEAATTEAPVSLPLQAAPAARWSASVVVVATRERIDPGALVQRDWGRWRVTAGATRGGAIVGAGFTW